MEEEIFILVVVSILAGSFLSFVRMILNHRKERHETSGASLTTSELQQLMREAVEDGTRPLVAKIEELEARERRARLEEGPRNEAPALAERSRRALD